MPMGRGSYETAGGWAREQIREEPVQSDTTLHLQKLYILILDLFAMGHRVLQRKLKA